MSVKSLKNKPEEKLATVKEQSIEKQILIVNKTCKDCKYFKQIKNSSLNIVNKYGKTIETGCFALPPLLVSRGSSPVPSTSVYPRVEESYYECSLFKEKQ